MLVQGEGREARIAMLGTGRKLRPVQLLGLLAGEAEHEVLGEPLEVAADLLVETLGGHAVEQRQVGVREDFMATDHQDAVGDLSGKTRAPGPKTKTAAEAAVFRFA